MKKIRQINTQVDNKNWQELFNIQFNNLQQKNGISRIWINGFSKLGIDNSKVPNAEYLNKISEKYTGWIFIESDSTVILSPREWYQMVAKRQMQVNRFVRTVEELSYCDEPDKWHDIIGHIPFLMESEYSDMYVKLANLYLESENDAEVRKYVDFIGAYVIELGLIKEDGVVRALGATLYSSSGELELSYKRENIEYFDKTKIFEAKKYDRSSFQGKYYIIDSIKQISNLIDELALSLNK